LIWRLVNEGKATLHELESTWCVDDVYRMNAFLDMQFDIEKEREKRTKKK